MHFSDDDLRAALKRKDPGEGFTQRVMARVNQLPAEGGKRPAEQKGRWFRMWWKLHPAWTAALAVALLFAVAFSGYEYSEYRHKEDTRLAQENQQRLEEAEKARDEAIQALEIARSKLNHVLERAQLPVENNDRTRRERL
jgi:hypothetical protein